MSRIGMNPARNRVGDYRPARVTVCILVYIPYLEGYFLHRLEVLKLCLGSLLANTRTPFDLLIFDNASCQEVRDYLDTLLEAGTLRYLLSSSENIGKVGAFRLMFGAAPGEVIAYADDDTFFMPGWLSEHLRLLDAFPEAGMVSGCALRTLYDHGIQSNLRLAEADPEVQLIRGQSIPEEWERDWAESVGRDPRAHLEMIRELEDLQLERNGISAYAVANHNQFLSPKAVLMQCLPASWSGRLMGEMNELDKAVDGGGYLRLSTMERTTRHIGNVISPGIATEAARYRIPLEAQPQSALGSSRSGFGRWLIRWKPTRWLLQGIYNRLFWLLSQQSGSWFKMEEVERK